MKGLLARIAALAAFAAPLACAQLPENDPPVVVPSITDWSGYDENAVAMVADLNLPGLTGGTVVQLDVPDPARHDLTLMVPIMELKIVHMHLVPNSVRAANFEVREQLADGSWRVADPGEEKTYTGSIREIPGSQVAASILSNGLFAMIYLPDGTRRWIEPLSEYVPGAYPRDHVVYRSEDTDCAGICGTDDILMTAPPAGGPQTRGGCGGSVCVAQLACDADWQYYDAHGSSTTEVRDRITAIVNVINHQYVREVALRHEITTILIRTAEPDPFSSFDPQTLLDQFRDEWETNQGGITRDLAHLFTGRELNGSVIGIAWVGAVCTSFGYGLSESDFSGTFACVTDLTAHEMGHNWGANHCACPDSTMNPSITCTNTFLNSAGQSTGEIDAYSDGVGCLGSASSLPANDTCDDATYIYTYGTYVGDNSNATSDGSQVACGSVGGGGRDVYWRFSPPASGTVTIDTCGSTFDTVLSVHDDCPATPDNMIVCDDDAGGSGDCPSTLQSYVSFLGLAGRQYYIRVAGYNSAVGTINLHISGPASPSESLCGLATEVHDGDTVFGSLFAAGSDGDSTCGASTSNRDVWYQFTASCAGTLSVDTCGTNDFPADDVGTDTVLSLHTACPGDTTSQIACNDDAGSFCNGGGILYDSHVTAALTQGQNVRIRVTHFGSSFNTGYFRIHVNFDSPLEPPAITPIGNTTILCGAAYTGPTPTLTDPTCMSPVTWSLVSGPAGMTINPATGVVSWSPAVVGNHGVTIRATNAAGNDTEPWTVRVDPIAPRINAILNGSATAGVPYTGPTPTLASACMNPVVYSLVAGPVGMSINAASGVVSWPNPTIVGSPHVVQIRATNASGFDDEVWAISVNAGNPCPADLDGDGDIDIGDLAILLSNFGTPGGASADDGDLDGDGDVDITDLAGLLSVFGTSCP